MSIKANNVELVKIDEYSALLSFRSDWTYQSSSLHLDPFKTSSNHTLLQWLDRLTYRPKVSHVDPRPTLYARSIGSKPDGQMT